MLKEFLLSWSLQLDASRFSASCVKKALAIASLRIVASLCMSPNTREHLMSNTSACGGRATKSRDSVSIRQFGMSEGLRSLRLMCVECCQRFSTLLSRLGAKYHWRFELARTGEVRRIRYRRTSEWSVGSTPFEEFFRENCDWRLRCVVCGIWYTHERFWRLFT